MKTVILSAALFLFAFTAKVSAQNALGTAPKDPTPLTIELENVMISSVHLQDGANSVPVPNNRGTLKFTRRAGKISNVIFVDAAGKPTTLTPARPGTNSAPQPACKYPLPDACFGGPQNIGLCMCKPTDLTNGNDTEVTIAMLLPAIQKVRN